MMISFTLLIIFVFFFNNEIKLLKRLDFFFSEKFNKRFDTRQRAEKNREKQRLLKGTHFIYVITFRLLSLKYL